MPTGSQTVATTVAQSLSDWINLSAARLNSKNSTYVTWDTTKVTQGIISGTGHGAALPSNALITSVEVELTYNDNGSTMSFPNPGLEYALTLDGTTAHTAWFEELFNSTGDITETHTFSGLSITAAQYNASTFGYLIRRNSGDEAADRWIDFMGLTPTYSLVDSASLEDGDEEEDMDLFAAGRAGGIEPLLTEALPACSASTAIFANAPAGTVFVEFEFRGQAVHISWDGTAASTAAGGGNKYPTGTVFRRPMTSSMGDSVKAIEDAATATGTITYWGMNN